MNKVQDILRKKGSGSFNVSPTDTVFEALQLMALNEIGALLVVDKGQLVGIFSERDYARKVVLRGKNSRDTIVQEVMSSKVVSVKPSADINECMGIMTQNHIRHLPILEDNVLLGIISIGDVVKAIISDKESVIVQLEGYIKGGIA